MRSARYGLTRDAATLDLADRNVRKALEIAPALPAGYVVRASIALNRGDYSQAIQDLQTAGRFDPENAEVQLTLAHAYAGSGKLELADRIYERLLEDRPNDWTPLNDWGSIYFRRANYPRAERLFREATIAAPGAGLPWRNLGAVCLVTNQFDEAQRALDRSISLVPSGEAYTNRALHYFGLADIAKRRKLTARRWI